MSDDAEVWRELDDLYERNRAEAEGEEADAERLPSEDEQRPTPRSPQGEADEQATTPSG